MKILCITHADFESPGMIQNWALDRGYEFIICKPYKGENCLTDSDYDFLVVMGGPQSPLKLEKYPYLKDEIALIQEASEQNKIILGFCLGAQLIGEALGASTAKSPEKEIGFFPVTLTEAGLSDPILQGFPKQFIVMHWHNDMPGETKDSKLLGFSEGCPRQIICYAPKIYGFQCHLEITREGMQELLKACPSDLKQSTFTQSGEVILQQDFDTVHGYMAQILDRLTKDGGSGD